MTEFPTSYRSYAVIFDIAKADDKTFTASYVAQKFNPNIDGPAEIRETISEKFPVRELALDAVNNQFRNAIDSALMIATLSAEWKDSTPPKK